MSDFLDGHVGYKDRSLLLVVIGVVLLLVGVGIAFVGPAEMYCFYLFSEGGRFHYDGFGFGSFMFGNIACQIAGYYLIAAVCIPLGYGHLTKRRWARTLSLALLGFWLVAGVPLIPLFLFILFASKEMSVTGGIIAVILVGLSYLVVSGLLIRFYRSRDVRLTFEARDPKSYGIEKLPVPVLVLCALFLFYGVALHAPILFNGLFPLFGAWRSGLRGILMLDVSIMGLLFLTWGVARLRTWAWWGSVAYFGLMTVSMLVTLCRSSLSDLLAAMNLPATEVEILGGMPLHGAHFAALIGIPLTVTLGLLVFSKRYFGAASEIPRFARNDGESPGQGGL